MRNRFHVFWLSLRLAWLAKRRRFSSLAPTAVISVGVVILVTSTLIAQMIHRPTIIDEISVPKTFAEEGYTAAVASERLRDAIETIEEDATRPPRDTTITGMAYVKSAGNFAASQDLARERPSIVVPFVGLSTESVSSLLASMIHAHRFSGEFVATGKRLTLTLRRDGKAFSTLQGRSDNPDSLLRTAADRIIELDRPSVVIASLCRSDPRKAIAEATMVLAQWDPASVEAERVHVLRGRMFEVKRDGANATRDFEAALVVNRDDAPAHNGLGNVLADKGSWTAAMTEYRLAAKADPNYAAPHVNMGAYYRKKKDFAHAITEYRAAAKLDPHYVLAWDGLAYSSSDGGQDGKAVITAYRDAIRLDGHNAVLHNNLGAALDKENGSAAEIIAEFREAVSIDPKYELAHRNLALALRKDNKIAEAGAESKLADDLKRGSQKKPPRIARKAEI